MFHSCIVAQRDRITNLQSLEIACDTILSGKAKVMIVGGFDDFSEEGSYEFANMGAMSNSRTEFAMGQEPNEMSRPTASTRDGVSFHVVGINDSIDTSFSSWRLKVAACKLS